ncbi:hypothetical protein MBLNU230_g7196t1 [Neophaeotheca triangularis]
MVLLASTPVANPSAKIPQTTGIRKNGKTWKPSKAPFRNTTSSSKNQYAKRVQRQTQEAAVKAAEKQLRAEKEEEREVSISDAERKKQKRGPWWNKTVDSWEARWLMGTNLELGPQSDSDEDVEVDFDED